MTTTTLENVRNLTGTKKPDAELTLMIRTAKAIVARCKSSCWSEDEKALVVAWLAAHFVATSGESKGAQTSRKLGDAQTSWSRAALGEGLKSSPYGQQVLLMDHCGCLAKLGKLKVSLTAWSVNP